MARVKYDGYTFDSEWEKEYYIYLCNRGDVCRIEYHPKPITDLITRPKYTPDFIYATENTISLVEIKSTYNPFSNKTEDKMIHKEMLVKTYDWLKKYFEDNNIEVRTGDTLKYERLKKYRGGWVDFDYKPPKRDKEKIKLLEAENKELNKFKKEALRYFSYLNKCFNNKKLTNKQQEWKQVYEETYVKEHTTE